MKMMLWPDREATWNNFWGCHSLRLQTSGQLQEHTVVGQGIEWLSGIIGLGCVVRGLVSELGVLTAGVASDFIQAKELDGVEPFIQVDHFIAQVSLTVSSPNRRKSLFSFLKSIVFSSLISEVDTVRSVFEF